MTTYLYHYHATTQKTVGAIEHWDGTIQTAQPIINQERYEEIKRSIADQFDGDANRLTVESLSLIWQEQPNGQG